jgi:methionyl-tRNA formyltransferase
MKIVFFGTPEFALPALQVLHDSEHEVVAVVTTPDKQKGRGMQVSHSPVKDFAMENGIPVIQPQDLADDDFIEHLIDLDVDLFVVVAFKILPKEVFDIPTYGAFNLHASLLPEYRGAAPIQWALINGEEETGITTFFLNDKVDTGNIILQKRILIREDDDYGSLHDVMSVMGAELILKTVTLIDYGNVFVHEQETEYAAPAPKITKETCQIDWNKPALHIHNLVRGLSPIPAAFFNYKDKTIKVFKTKVIGNEKLGIGNIKETKHEIFVGTGDGVLQLLELQLEGGKRMDADEFLRGHSLKK